MISIDPDTLLASDFESITDAARTATQQLHQLDLNVQNGDVSPDEAAARLRLILEPLQIAHTAASWMKPEPVDQP